LEAAETLQVASIMAVEMGFEVLGMRPGRIELERTVDDVHDEITLELIADPIGAN
jgi:hypothetical protein